LPQAQTVSIKKIRADALVAWRGVGVLAVTPAAYLFFRLINPILRDHRHFDLALLRSPLVWLLVALTVSGVFAIRHGLHGMTAFNLWILVIGSGLIVIGGLVCVVTAGIIDPTQLAQKSVGVVLAVAALLIVIVIALYWMLLSPTMAALRLLGTRLPPDGIPLPTVLASPLPQRDAGDRVAPFKKKSPAVAAYRVAALALYVVSFVQLAWLYSERLTRLAILLAVAGGAFARVLWRRGRKHAAIDAQAALRSDPRRPILYVRSFRDDPRMMDRAAGLGAGLRRHQGPIAQAIRGMENRIFAREGGGRLEEILAAVVAPIGPFVAIGAPGEPLPELGAARAYFTNDTWQSEVIEWMHMAQLIVAVAGPTHSLGWELDTILNRDAWPKLLVLMPPSRDDGNTAATWDNIVAALQDRPCRDALAGLDPHEVVAMRLLEGGGISAVTSDRRTMADYVLAMRFLLHQMQEAVAPR
jgi:hypothetical protein